MAYYKHEVDGKNVFKWDDITLLAADNPIYYASDTQFPGQKYGAAVLLVKALEYTNESPDNASAHDAGVYNGRYSIGS
jgi:hypothetical protein